MTFLGSVATIASIMENTEKKYLSKEKHKELKKELEELTGSKRKEIAEQLEYAKSLGDLSENAEYHEARDAQAKLEARISEIENILKIATIVSEKQHTIAEVGSRVTIKNNETKEKEEWQIVGSEEADFEAGKISNESPLGEALMGKGTGDTAEITTRKGTTTYSILKIE